jgi:predicted transcriptional regulator
MLTTEQKKEIVKMYKEQIPLKVIGFTLGIAVPTVASYIRRNHPNLQRWNTEKRMNQIAKEHLKVAKDLNLEKTTASAIYTILLEKFENKRKNATKEFNVEFSDITIPTVCPYLGIPLDFYASPKADNSPTFDRVDNTKGYVKGNVVVCSWRANRLKNDGTAEEHEKIAAFMKQHI